VCLSISRLNLRKGPEEVNFSPLWTRSRKAGTSRLDHDKRPGDTIAKFGNDTHDGLTKATSRITWKTNQDDSRRLLAASVREQSKVFVFVEENSRLRAGKSENGRILGAAIDLPHCGDMVAGRTESGNYGKAAALVGEKTHRLLFAAGCAFADENDFFVGERIRRVAHRGLDVLAREPRVSLREIRFGRTFAQFPKNEFHRNPRSTDDRLSKHHVGIDFDAVRESHLKPLSRIHPRRGDSTCMDFFPRRELRKSEGWCAQHDSNVRPPGS
jgi:hypothetical protein